MIPLNVKTPKTYEITIKNLFYQVAAKYGCADHLHADDETVTCVKNCANCIFAKIGEEYKLRLNNITLRFLDEYLDDVQREELFPQTV